MAVLIGIRSKFGIIATCDARCYNAEKDSCGCVCGGANHGVGLEKALENTRGHGDTWLARWLGKNQTPPPHNVIHSRGRTWFLLRV